MLARLFAAGVFCLMGAQAVFAACVEDFRPVPVGEQTVEVKSYICRSENAHFKVEFHRLTAGAASSVFLRTRTDLVAPTLGAPAVVENEVFATVADIVRRFSSRYEAEWATPLLFVAVPRGGAGETLASDKAPDMVVLDTDWEGTDGFYYPAIDEIEALEGGRLPDGLKRKGEDQVWRFMRDRDLSDYAANLDRFNLHFTGDAGAYAIDARGDPTIALMSYLAGDSLPSDFSALVGYYSEGGCVEGMGWVFRYLPRIPIVDALAIENLSAEPLRLEALLGSATSGGLRPPERRGGQTEVLRIDETIDRGQRVLVPLQLTFAPSDELREFTASSYAFGPAYEASGLTANGDRILFEERSANFTRLSLLAESGSCPFLLSKRTDDGRWIDRGKVLHLARGVGNEYREVLAFEGLRTEFRLEEREPELAHIDEATLVVTLRDGSERTFLPDRRELAGRDGSRIPIRWGEAVAFSFPSAASLDPAIVAETRLAVTGYYERYSSLPSIADAGRIAPGSGGALLALASSAVRDVEACLLNPDARTRLRYTAYSLPIGNGPPLAD
jgi:hypothetical protein